MYSEPVSLLLQTSLEPQPSSGEQVVSLTLMACLNGLRIKMWASFGSSYKMQGM